MKQITAYKKEDFRSWLQKNHEKENQASVIIHKKHTGKPRPTTNELMREAICFGWIDTTANRLDEDRFMIKYVKRNKNSKWSDNTLKYAKELIKEKKMTPAGLKFYKEGLAKPTHDHGIPKNPDMPEELKKELEKNQAAKAKFEKFPPSTKRMLYRWLLRAKQKETKEKRVKQIIYNASVKNPTARP